MIIPFAFFLGYIRHGLVAVHRDLPRRTSGNEARVNIAKFVYLVIPIPFAKVAHAFAIRLLAQLFEFIIEAVLRRRVSE